MKVLVVSGIWPPDVGGPASHAPEVAAWLRERGHHVEVVVTASSAPAAEPYPVRWSSRSLPKGVLHVRSALEIARAARAANVVYATGMFGRTAAACELARTPFVLKLTGDPAFERMRSRRPAIGGIEDFQRGAGGIEAVALRRLRDHTVRRAAHIVCPSAYLRELAISWGAAPQTVSVLPNAIPGDTLTRDRAALRAAFGIDGPTVSFAGRFGPQKALDVLVAAIEQVPDVTLLLAGEGEPPPHGPRVRPLGPLGRAQALDLFAASDAVVLASLWENFPHALVEALAMGTPVVATAVGGVTEIVEHEVNGLLVPPGDAQALAAAIRRVVHDEPLRARLAGAAVPSVRRFEPEQVYGELEQILERASA